VRGSCSISLRVDCGCLAFQTLHAVGGCHRLAALLLVEERMSACSVPGVGALVVVAAATRMQPLHCQRCMPARVVGDTPGPDGGHAFGPVKRAAE